MNKTKVQISPSQQVEAWRLDFKPVSEPWCEYECEDGTRVRVKLVVSEIYRLEGSRTPTGDPIYFVRSTNLMTADVPEALKKPPVAGSAGTYA